MIEVAIFDFDKTIFSKDSIVRFTEFLLEKKIIDIDIWDSNFSMDSNKAISNFKKKLLLISKLEGFSIEFIEKLFIDFSVQNLDNYFPQTIIELERNINEGRLIICISASFDLLVRKMLEIKNIKIDFIFGTKLEFDNGICTGKINGLNASGINKFYIIKDWLNENNFSTNQIMEAYTDHISDISFLLLAKNKFVIKSKYWNDDWSALLDVNYIIVD